MPQISLFIPIRPAPLPAKRQPTKSHRRLLWLTAALLALTATLYVTGLIDPVAVAFVGR